ncbi:extracellular solute-binding protein [Aerococcaceae bacterium zg-ZUI334]|uniref:ABC transporter substrate-binding protein n=1 Tax=Aerococcaceae bacterium zg-252 TaxID=2796928 RepID=UPI001B8EAD72|nr:extracellular solute-binding protein [Aerococcaceae bacterium zg-ZUI334]
MKKVFSFILLGCMFMSQCFSNYGSLVHAAEKKIITVMASGVKNSNNGRFLDDLKKIIEVDFPEYSVETTLLPDDQYHTALKSKLSTGQAPDIFLVQPKKASANSVEGMAAAGFIEDLSDLSNWDNLVDQAKADMSLDGKPYAVSSSIGVLGTWYNKDLFTENGIALPTNWEEFLTACEKLKSAGITPIVMGDKDSYMIQFGMYQIAANQVYPGNPEFDNKLYSDETKFTNLEWVTTISMYKELYDKEYVTTNSLGLGQPQAQQMFVDKKAAMIFDGDFSFGAFSNVDFNLGFMGLPANKEGETYIAAATSAGYAISSKSEHKEMLKEVFNKMMDGESSLYDAFAKSASSFSTFKNVEVGNEVFNDVVPAFEKGKSFYWCNQAWPSGTETEMQAKFSEMIGTKRLSPEEVAEAMQIKFEELR